MKPNNSHGGKRKGAGRKPALLPVHTKKLRATAEEWNALIKLLNGDARVDFILIHEAVRNYYRNKT